jgi:hypothetical protein
MRYIITQTVSYRNDFSDISGKKGNDGKRLAVESYGLLLSSSGSVF